MIEDEGLEVVADGSTVVIYSQQDGVYHEYCFTPTDAIDFARHLVGVAGMARQNIDKELTQLLGEDNQ